MATAGLGASVLDEVLVHYYSNGEGDSAEAAICQVLADILERQRCVRISLLSHSPVHDAVVGHVVVYSLRSPVAGFTSCR